MIAKSKIIGLIIISICAVLAVTFGCVFGLNNASPKTDLNTSVNASTYTSGNYVYTYTSGSGTCTISANTNSRPSGVVSLPSSVTINGAIYTVTGITSASKAAYGAFYNCGITSLTIPSTITSIGDYAFYSCKTMTTLNYNATSVSSVSRDTFLNLGRSSSGVTINIGSNVTRIPINFMYVTNADYYPNVTSIVFEPNSSCSRIGAHAFSCCEVLETFTFPDCDTTLEQGVFYSCYALTTLKIKNKIKVEITNGNSYSYMFQGCSALVNVYVDDIDSYCDSEFSSGSYEYPFYDNASKGNCSLYVNNVKVNNITISSSKIFPCAFQYLTQFNSVTITDSVTNIGDYAFYKCTNLSKVTIGSGVANIGNYAFANCSALTEVMIPNSVTTIYSYAFCYCSALTSVFFMQFANFGVGDAAFLSNSSLCAYYFVSQDILNRMKTSYSSCFTNTSFYLCSVVAFESNGGTECASKAVVSGVAYGTLPTPTRVGYEFGGWYTNSSLTGSAVSESSIVNGTHTLYAKWIFDVIKISVSGSSTSLSSQKIIFNEITSNVIAKPQSGHYVSQISFDNSTFYPIEYAMGTITNQPFALTIVYHANTSSNSFGIDLNYIESAYLSQNINIYLVTTTTPYTELKSSGGTSISGVALQVQNISETSTLACVGEARINGYSTSEGLTSVHVSAVASSGYQFVGWTTNEEDDLSAYNNMSVDIPYSLVEGKILIAQFQSTSSNVNDDLNN